MTNASVIARMLELVERVEQRDMSATELERSFESHIGALERIGTTEVSRARDLCYLLVKASVEEGEPDADRTVASVIRELRTFLSSLPE